MRLMSFFAATSISVLLSFNISHSAGNCQTTQDSNNTLQHIDCSDVNIAQIEVYSANRQFSGRRVILVHTDIEEQNLACAGGGPNKQPWFSLHYDTDDNLGAFDEIYTMLLLAMNNGETVGLRLVQITQSISNLSFDQCTISAVILRSKL